MRSLQITEPFFFPCIFFTPSSPLAHLTVPLSEALHLVRMRWTNGPWPNGLGSGAISFPWKARRAEERELLSCSGCAISILHWINHYTYQRNYLFCSWNWVVALISSAFISCKCSRLLAKMETWLFTQFHQALILLTSFGLHCGHASRVDGWVSVSLLGLCVQAFGTDWNIKPTVGGITKKTQFYIEWIPPLVISCLLLSIRLTLIG